MRLRFSRGNLGSPSVHRESAVRRLRSGSSSPLRRRRRTFPCGDAGRSRDRATPRVCVRGIRRTPGGRRGHQEIRRSSRSRDAPSLSAKRGPVRIGRRARRVRADSGPRPGGWIRRPASRWRRLRWRRRRFGGPRPGGFGGLDSAGRVPAVGPVAATAPRTSDHRRLQTPARREEGQPAGTQAARSHQGTKRRADLRR